MVFRYGWQAILLSFILFSTPGISAANPVSYDEVAEEEVFLSPYQQLLLEGCEEEYGSELEISSPIDRALGIAHSLLGSPYSPGGSSPRGFDCSGLVRYVFSQVGIELPHSSRAQFGHVNRISREELQPGDLLFFKISRKRISHVGIYIDENRFIHAPTNGRAVSYASLNEPYWKKRFAGAGRLQVSSPGGPDS